MHLNSANSLQGSVSSMISDIDVDSGDTDSDNDDAKFVERAGVKISPVKHDVMRKIEDMLEAKRLRAEFDF
ncbi:MAG: hypothetical protein ACI9W1_002231 [Candidatus Azotimanducaceae bacterium]|jgi:hypothetical protein